MQWTIALFASQCPLGSVSFALTGIWLKVSLGLNRMRQIQNATMSGNVGPMTSRGDRIIWEIICFLFKSQHRRVTFTLLDLFIHLYMFGIYSLYVIIYLSFLFYIYLFASLVVTNYIYIFNSVCILRYMCTIDSCKS